MKFVFYFRLLFIVYLCVYYFKVVIKFVDYFAAGGLFEGGLFDDAPMPEVPAIESTTLSQEKPPESPMHDSDDDMDHFGGPPSVGGHR